MTCGIFFFSQYINGGNLEQLLDSNKYLSWATRVKLALEIAMGLSYLHSKGIFHRDLTSKVIITIHTLQCKSLGSVRFCQILECSPKLHLVIPLMAKLNF